jgi:hypothetical protein
VWAGSAQSAKHAVATKRSPFFLINALQRQKEKEGAH